MGATLLGLYEKAIPSSLTLEDKLKVASRFGFDFLEISIDETDEKLGRLKWTTKKKKDLAQAMSSTGIPIKTLCLSGHRKYPLGSADAQTRRRGLEILADAVDFAANLGIRIIQLAGYDCYYEPSTEASKAHFRENLELCVHLAARQGVVLAFETMETEFMNTVGKAMVYVKALDSPYLQIYPDLGNLTNAALASGTSVLDDLSAGKGHLVALHLKETVPGKFREIPYGTGHVNFDAAIGRAKDLGVRLFLAEFWDTGSPDWEGHIAFAQAFLRKKL